MKTIAVGLLGILLTYGTASAQTIGEQAQVLRDFEQNVADYTMHQACLDPVHKATAARAPRIFTLPVAMVFRQLITKALDEHATGTAIGGVGNRPRRHPFVLEPFPPTELLEFPEVLADALPLLPPSLEYRLIGRDLVVRDTDTNLIAGVLRDAVGALSTIKR